MAPSTTQVNTKRCEKFQNLNCFPSSKATASNRGAFCGDGRSVVFTRLPIPTSCGTLNRCNVRACLQLLKNRHAMRP